MSQVPEENLEPIDGDEEDDDEDLDALETPAPADGVVDGQAEIGGGR